MTRPRRLRAHTVNEIVAEFATIQNALGDRFVMREAKGTVAALLLLAWKLDRLGDVAESFHEGELGELYGEPAP